MKKDGSHRPTIIDVAKRAGVSKSTVARVLAGARNISDKARAQVLDAVAAIRYEPNRLAIGMRSGRSGCIGIVIPDIANPFWAEVARGAQDRAARDDISLLIFSSDWDREREATHFRSLRRARVDGAIINPVADNGSNMGDLDRFGLPFVLIGSSAERFPNTSSIGSDIAQAVHIGMDALAARGHHAPALLLGPKRRLARARFLQAVHDYYVVRDADPAQLLQEETDYTLEGGRKGALRLLAHQKPGESIAIFAANDLMALGALMAVREAGLDCPRDVSLLGFDGIPAGAYSWPALTTIEKPGRRIGAQAVECLLGELAGQPKHGRIYLSCRLIERDSLAHSAPGR